MTSDINSYTEKKYASKGKACLYCGFLHSQQSRCPTMDRVCNKCKKYNHFEKVCRSWKIYMVEKGENAEDKEEEEQSEDLVIGIIRAIDNKVVDRITLEFNQIVNSGKKRNNI